jgi:hypothetical protein
MVDERIFLAILSYSYLLKEKRVLEDEKEF